MEQTAAALGRSSGATKMLVTRGLSAVRTRMRRDAKKEEDS
jgi:DNA-directed RNA polymerase specialized sigma24 family protein